MAGWLAAFAYAESADCGPPPQAIQQGNVDVARVYAENAIRYKTQAVNYLKLSSRIEAVAARVEAAIRMNQVSRSMAGIVQGMEKAMQQMDTEKITQIMDQFEQQFEDVDVQTQYMDTAMNQTTTLSTPADQARCRPRRPRRRCRMR